MEVGTLAELDEALAAGAPLVLLDNMSVPHCAEAVHRAAGSATELEASGGLTLDIARDYAATGVATSRWMRSRTSPQPWTSALTCLDRLVAVW